MTPEQLDALIRYRIEQAPVHYESLSNTVRRMTMAKLSK